MIEDLKIGLANEKKFKVVYEQTAIAKGSGTVEVFSTPNLILEMEEVSLLLMQQYLPEGLSSVGTKIDVKHMAATPVGMEVTIKAKIKEVDRKRIVFEVSAYDKVEKIGEGIHERFIIDTEKFTLKANNKK